MKPISVFDVIGPNMIGPSSSHTAGALKIARVMYKLAPQNIAKATFVLFGSFAKTYKGHGTDKALIAGLLGMQQDDERIKNAFEYAAKEGLNYEFKMNTDKQHKHPNTVEIIILDTENNELSISGASIGGGSITIDKVNGMEVFFSGEFYTLFITHEDQPGVVAHITRCLSQYAINIAFMRLYRQHKYSQASTIIEADEPITEEVIHNIMNHKNVHYAKIIDL